MTTIVRRVDRQELSRLISSGVCGNFNPTQAKAFNRCLLATAKVWVGFVDDKLLCTWGLVPPSLMDTRAYLWLQTTPAVEDHLFTFVRQSQIAVQEMLKEYPLIVGQCKVGADRSIRWLRWLGAVFDEPVGEFVPFKIIAKELANG